LNAEDSGDSPFLAKSRPSFVQGQALGPQKHRNAAPKLFTGRAVRRSGAFGCSTMKEQIAQRPMAKSSKAWDATNHILVFHGHLLSFAVVRLTRSECHLKSSANRSRRTSSGCVKKHLTRIAKWDFEAIVRQKPIVTTPTSTASNSNKKPRILVIEDDADVRCVLRTTLCSRGFDVTTASTGNEGIQFLANGQFDLVLSDIDLPDVSGLEICRRLKLMRGHCPIILMSGRFGEEAASLASSHGADDFIAKPFSAQALHAKISTLTGLRRREGLG